MSNATQTMTAFQQLTEMHRNGLKLATEVTTSKDQNKKYRGVLQFAAAQFAVAEHRAGIRFQLFPKGHKRSDKENSWASSVSQGRTAVEYAVKNNDLSLLNTWHTGLYDDETPTPQAYIKLCKPVSEAEKLAKQVEAAIKLLGNLHDAKQYAEAIAAIEKIQNFRRNAGEVEAVSIVTI